MTEIVKIIDLFGGYSFFTMLTFPVREHGMSAINCFIPLSFASLPDAFKISCLCLPFSSLVTMCYGRCGFLCIYPAVDLLSFLELEILFDHFCEVLGYFFKCFFRLLLSFRNPLGIYIVMLDVVLWVPDFCPLHLFSLLFKLSNFCWSIVQITDFFDISNLVLSPLNGFLISIIVNSFF